LAPTAIRRPAVVDFISFLQDLFNNEVVYLLATFWYSILVAIVLPIPVELALLPPLLARRFGLFAEAAFAVAAGKTVGAWLIFRIGLRVENSIRFWSDRYPLARRLVSGLGKFVEKTGYIGLYILLSIPFMSDTVPVYLYSLFNEEGKWLSERTYLLSNFLAAINRSAIWVLIFLVSAPLVGA